MMSEQRGSISETVSEDRLAGFLARDPVWGAYALCDLEPPQRDRSRFLAYLWDDEIQGLLLFYALPGWSAALPFGDEAVVERVVEDASDLPPRILFVGGDAYLSALAQRYDCPEQWDMWRMAVRSDRLRQARPIEFPMRRLATADLPAIQTLYAEYSDAAFDLSMLQHGVYVGAFDGTKLIAVAGTHAISARYRVAAIGGVLTLAAYRGRGLAATTTHAVCTYLASTGIELLVLNVRQDNSHAIRAYQRLGFGIERAFLEGYASLRSAP